MLLPDDSWPDDSWPDDTWPDLPARPLLRPGVRVCRRSATELQVGLDRSLAVAVPDTAEVRAALTGLARGARPHPRDRAVARLLSRLHERGLLVDGDAWLAAVGRTPSPEAAASVTAVVAEHGVGAANVLEGRRATGVLVDDLGLPAAAERLRELLDHTGVGHGDDLVVLLCGEEPDRDLVDHWMRADVPHVLLTASEGVLRLGPFVDPGRTACLRCLDAAATEHDPRHGLVVRQYADAPPAADGLPAPLPADLLDVAVGHLARDVTRWVDGRLPRTWSATVRLDDALDLSPVPLPRHPGCGCAWAVPATG
jgi:bacteriocin biosynthesis cyclodehydratase domain-containing protein